MTALSTWAPEDGLLGAVAPLALAATRTTALVVDLDPRGPHYPGSGSLARLVEDGPRRADLEPARRGVAVLRNGGVTAKVAAPVVEALVGGWPAVVLRLPARHRELGAAFRVPCVPFRLLVPPGLFPPPTGPSVWQSVGWAMAAPGPGPVLPRPGAAAVRALMSGVKPPAGRWLRGVAKLWGVRWQ